MAAKKSETTARKDKTDAIARQVGNFATKIRDAKSKRAPKLSETSAAAFREAFARGGLDAVDELIDLINEKLKESGATCGLAPGCACEHDFDGDPVMLCLRFSDFDAANPFASHWISLPKPEQLPT